MTYSQTHTLPNDVTIPALGLGTWFIDDDKAAPDRPGCGEGRLPQHRYRPSLRQ